MDGTKKVISDGLTEIKRLLGLMKKTASASPGALSADAVKQDVDAIHKVAHDLHLHLEGTETADKVEAEPGSVSVVATHDEAVFAGELAPVKPGAVGG
jgi:hypothetical protein